MQAVKLLVLKKIVVATLIGCIASLPLVLSSNSISAAVPKSASVRTVSIQLDHKLDVVLPETQTDLQPAAIRTSDGKTGWVIRIPGGLPIATPAYADGKLFVGGGYGSHAFYAFDAETGAKLWEIETSDDGPSAAVTEDGYVAFNTESCTLFITDARTGRVIWKEWLGDPLMSQPAISKGRVYIAHPAGRPGNSQSTSSDAGGKVNSHRLLSADLKTGRHIWTQEISGDAMSAPVVAGDTVYVTSFDGTSYAFGASDGHLIWKKEGTATSAPSVSGGQMLQTRKLKVQDQTFEGVARMDAADGKDRDSKLLAPKEAAYLDENTNARGLAGGLGGAAQTLDASVGFALPPPAAQMQTVTMSVGVSTVAAAWAYQGSRAILRNGRILNAQGKNLNALDAATGKVLWQAEAVGKDIAEAEQLFSPPALGQDNMYLGSALGLLLSVRQKDGKPQFLYSLKHPVTFQPALARGNIYIGTTDGLLICLKTGDFDADGWYAWGGNAQHNK